MTRLLLSLVMTWSAVLIQTSAARPSFAGTWSPVEGVSPAVNLSVAQTTAGLVATTGDGHRMECSFDGQATKQKDENADITARWNGSTLVLTIAVTSEFGDTNVMTQTWSVDQQDRLVIETTNVRRGQTKTARAVYRKASSTRL